MSGDARGTYLDYRIAVPPRALPPLSRTPRPDDPALSKKGSAFLPSASTELLRESSEYLAAFDSKSTSGITINKRHYNQYKNTPQKFIFVADVKPLVAFDRGSASCCCRYTTGRLGAGYPRSSPP